MGGSSLILAFTSSYKIRPLNLSGGYLLTDLISDSIVERCRSFLDLLIPLYADNMIRKKLSQFSFLLSQQKFHVLLDPLGKLWNKRHNDQFFAPFFLIISLFVLFLNNDLGFPVVLPFSKVHFCLDLPLLLLIMPVGLCNFELLVSSVHEYVTSFAIMSLVVVSDACVPYGKVVAERVVLVIRQPLLHQFSLFPFAFDLV